jgi:halimadienyl-diphosphate synthase
LAWVLINFSFSGVPLEDFADESIWEQIRQEMSSRGVGLDATFGIPDADTTAVSLYVLAKSGYDVDPRILLQFEDQERRIFRTYHYERNPSVSTNIHALEALDVIPDYPDRQAVKENVIAMLLDGRHYNVYWTDKWHASPYYVTAHTLIALLKAGEYLAKACQPTIDWIAHTQHDDGSWGFFQTGTAEETAYALTVLLHCYQRQIPVDVEVLHRGADYLAERHEASDGYPDLWLGKDLYSPRDVVRSAILSALILYDRLC